MGDCRKMMTTYEKNFINERISYEEASAIIGKDILFFKGFYDDVNNRFSLFESFCKIKNKSILELCFEIKPITAERLNAISIEQWKMWADRYDIPFAEEDDNLFIEYHQNCGCDQYGTTYTENTRCCRIHPYFKDKVEVFIFCYEMIGFLLLRSTETSYKLKLSYELSYEDHDNFIKQTKAINDLVWELENI